MKPYPESQVPYRYLGVLIPTKLRRDWTSEGAHWFRIGVQSGHTADPPSRPETIVSWMAIAAEDLKNREAWKAENS